MTLELKQYSILALVVLLLALVLFGPGSQKHRNDRFDPIQPKPAPNRTPHYRPNTDPDMAEQIKHFDRKAREAATESYLKTKAQFAAAREKRGQA